MALHDGLRLGFNRAVIHQSQDSMRFSLCARLSFWKHKEKQSIAEEVALSII